MLEHRHDLYNENLDFIEKLEEDKKAIVIRPSQTLNVGRVERDSKKLTELYNLGYQDASAKLNEISEWFQESRIENEVFI